MRHTATGITVFLLLVASVPGTALAQGGTLRIGMTASNTGFRINLLKSVRKIDDYTVEFESVKPSSFVPYQLLYVMMVSPANWAKTGKDWRKYGESPSGTGPFRVTRFVPRERLELEV